MKKTMTKIRESLTNNVGIKIVAVLVAAIVWLAVININDPEKTIIIYNIPITVTNEDVITDMGMVYTLESKNSINITVSGKRSIVSDLSADDFTATASLKELSKVNSVPVDVSARKNSIAGKITVVKQSLQTVTVNIEEIEKQDFDVEVVFSGKTAEGYVAGDYSVSNKTVTIKAPTSVLDRIARVVATCDLGTSDTYLSQKCRLTLYDKRGKAIKMDNVKMSVKKVDVFVNILKEKEIPVSVNSVENPPNGYQTGEIALSQEKVKIIGTKEALAEITKLEVNGAIDISNQTKDVTKEIDLNQYLPEGVKISGDSKIEVTIRIDKLVSKTYAIKASEIEVKNLKDGERVKFSDKEIKVTLRGEKEVMKEITKEDMNASVDLEGYEKGTVTVPVSITIPDGTELVESINVKLKIK